MRIKNLTPENKIEVIDMMRIFYASDAVLSNGSDEIFEHDVDACTSDNPYIEGYVFEENQEIVGYAMLAKSFSTEFGKQCIWIEDIYIKPQFHHMGMGKAFFEMLFSTYQDVIFRLEAEEDNHNAVALYEKCGFEVLPYMEMVKK